MPRHRLPIPTAALLGAALAAPLLAAQAADPSVRLFDSGRPAAGARDLPALWGGRQGTAVPEDARDHRFAGRAVVRNDKVALVLTADSLATVYALGPAGAAEARAGFSRRGTLASVRVVENGPGAVELEAAYRSDRGQPYSCRFRLTAGEPFVRLVPGEGMTGLGVWTRGVRVVVPEFFGDDFVPAAPAGDDPPGDIPAENAVLTLGAGGGSAVLCVWQAAGTDTRLRLPFRSLTVRPGAAAYGLACRPAEPVWIACLEGPGLWHEKTAGVGAGPADVLRGFRPPFPAKWRADFVGPDGACDSVTFEAPPEAAPVPATWRGPVLFYPVDRSRATPLTTLLPIDVLRATLGVGPCQYVLALEGLGADAPPTPDAVTKWVERLVKRKQAARSADEIRDRLDGMLAHLSAARRRIEAYETFGRQARAACLDAAADERAATDAAAVLAVCVRLEADVARGREGMKTPEEWSALAGRLAALAAEETSLAAFAPVNEALGAVGLAQNETLARCRMAVRRVRTCVRPGGTEFAKKIEGLADGLLRRP